MISLIALSVYFTIVVSAAIAEPPVKFIQAARSQIGVTTGYDGSYAALSYPGGDINIANGVCVDVVVRAYRDAYGIDLQQVVHEDMKRAFQAYPNIWGLTRPDANIDHRRVPNIETWLSRQNAERTPHNWQPGDIISMRLPGNLPHMGIISDRKSSSGRWLVIHNIGNRVIEGDIIDRFDQQKRYRYIP